MSEFVHRHNSPVETIDSICKRCFQTIATRKTEAELAKDEADHVCAEQDMRRLAEVLEFKKPA